MEMAPVVVMEEAASSSGGGLILPLILLVLVAAAASDLTKLEIVDDLKAAPSGAVFFVCFMDICKAGGTAGGCINPASPANYAARFPTRHPCAHRCH